LGWATLRLSTFKAIFNNLLIADTVTGQSTNVQAQPGPSWADLLLLVTQHCVAGQDMILIAHSNSLCQLANRSVASCLLVSLPVLLLHLDRQAHHGFTIHQWVQHLNLAETAASALVDLYGVLCQVHDMHETCQHRLCPKMPLMRQLKLSTPVLVEAQELLLKVQSQFWLGFQLAQGQGWDGDEIGILALLATLQSEENQFPLSLHRELWVSAWIEGDPSVYEAERQRWLELSTSLYYRWGGVYLGQSAPHCPPVGNAFVTN
jgi:hypothetical protein